MKRIVSLLTLLLAATASAQQPVTNEAELRAALDSGAAVIKIYDGPLVLSATFRIWRGDFTLRGAGPRSALVRRATGDDPQAEFVVYVRPPLGGKLENIAFENLTFDMTLAKEWSTVRKRTPAGCLRVTSFADRGVRGVAVRNCRFHMRSERGWKGISVYVLRVGAQYAPRDHSDRRRIKDIYIEDNLFTDTSGQQIQVDKCERARVRRNVVIDPGPNKRGGNTIFRTISAHDVIFEHNYLFNRAANTSGTAMYIGGSGGLKSTNVTYRYNVIDSDAPGEAIKLVGPLGAGIRLHNNRLSTPGGTRSGLVFRGDGDWSGVWLFANSFAGFRTERVGDPKRARIVANVGLADVVPTGLEEAK